MRSMLGFLLSFSSGAAVGIGASAFLAALGVGARLAGWTGTQRHIGAYSWSMIAGLASFTLLYLFDWRIGVPAFVAIAAMLLMGAFIGMQACALAEVLDGLPHTLSWMPPWAWRVGVLGLILGKILFSVIDLLYAK